MTDREPGIIEELKARNRLVPRDYALYELFLIGTMLVFVWLPLFVVTRVAEKLRGLRGGETE